MFIIRHGEQLYPHNEHGEKMVSDSNAPLVELGRNQIRQLGKVLLKQEQKLDAAYSSPILRTDQSKHILEEVMRIPYSKTIYELREVDPCSTIGHTYKELEDIDGDIYAHPFSEDQETLDHLVERSKEALRKILADAKEHGFESIAIVGHGDPLCALYWSLRNEGFPLSYADMKNGFYPQKGEAYLYTVSEEEPLRITGEGRRFTAESAQQTIESFRNSFSERK